MGATGSKGFNYYECKDKCDRQYVSLREGQQARTNAKKRRRERDIEYKRLRDANRVSSSTR